MWHDYSTEHWISALIFFTYATMVSSVGPPDSANDDDPTTSAAIFKCVSLQYAHDLPVGFPNVSACPLRWRSHLPTPGLRTLGLMPPHCVQIYRWTTCVARFGHLRA